MSNAATVYGPVAEQEFDSAPDWARPDLTAWLERLPTLSDDEFTDEAMSAIHNSALVNSFRGNWNHDHCKATAAFSEAQRRYRAAGHTGNCTGDTIYAQAFRRVWRSQGHDLSAYPVRLCDCGAAT